MLFLENQKEFSCINSISSLRSRTFKISETLKCEDNVYIGYTFLYHLTGAEFGSDVPNFTQLINLANFHKYS